MFSSLSKCLYLKQVCVFSTQHCFLIQTSLQQPSDVTTLPVTTASTFCFLLFLLPLPVVVVGAGGTATGATPSCSLCSTSTGSTFFITTGDWSGFTSAGGSSVAHHSKTHNHTLACNNYTLNIIKTSQAEEILTDADTKFLSNLSNKEKCVL